MNHHAHWQAGSDQVDGFLESLTARGCSSSTVQTRDRSLAKFMSFASIRRTSRIQDVTIEMLEGYRLWLADQRLKPSTVETHLRSVKHFFGWLERSMLLFSNPASALTVPRYHSRLGRVLTVGEVRALLDTPDTSRLLGLRDRAILELLYATAVRRREAALLTLSDIDLDRETVRVLGKGGKERAVPVGRNAVGHIRRYLEAARPQLAGRSQQERRELWINKDGEPLSEQVLGLLPRRYARKARIAGQVSPHTLRRSCATHMLQNGAHPLMVSEMLGHADTKTLAHYLRISVSDLKETHSRSNPGR
jgi:integrase/recombinase XerD